jgi:sialate O-acetylesterase
MNHSIFKAADIFQDGMILQREKPIKIWGTGPENSSVKVRLGESIAKAIVKDGKWTVILPAQQASECTGLDLTCDNYTIRIKNVAIGEVWLAGGQSNMELPLKLDPDFKNLSKTVNDSMFRYYEVPKLTYNEQPSTGKISEQGKWYACNKKELNQWCGTGFYFGRMLRENLGVPVGIIACNYGGSPVMSWIEQSRLAKDPDFHDLWYEYSAYVEELDIQQYQKAHRMKVKLMNSWFMDVFSFLYFRAKFPDSLIKYIWSKRGGKPVAPIPVGPWDPWRPSGLYETMLRTVIGFTIRGAIWYQGEADTRRHENYDRLMELVINSWREEWEDCIPFIQVELAPFGHDIFECGELYPEIREKQRLVAEKMTDVYTISIMDSGVQNNIHPRCKKTVGERLAAVSSAKVYGLKVPWQFPAGTKAEWDGEEVIVTFSAAEEGLIKSGDEPVGNFELFKGSYKVAIKNVKLYGNTVILIASEKPTEVRFAWVGYCKVNLFNKNGFPAAPFKLSVQ